MAPTARICSLGGATEASIWSIWYEIEQVPIPRKWLSIPYGFGMANQPWHILDEHLYPVPLGVIGELFIGGVGLAIESADAMSLQSVQLVCNRLNHCLSVCLSVCLSI